jgi:hypothetical protein
VPLCAYSRIIHHFHTRVFTYVAVASHCVTRVAIGPTRYTVILPIVVRPFTTIRILRTNIGDVIDKVLLTVAEALTILKGERWIKTRSARTER